MYVKRIKKSNTKYEYKDLNSGKIINTKASLDYIKKLAIPPAYKNVTISLNPNDEVAFKGYDKNGREQRIYSAKHNIKAANKKYCSLSKFVSLFPKINKDVNALLQNGEGKERLIAIVLKIMSLCYFRVGNEKYQKKYNSYGISTIEKKHVKPSSGTIKISFIGKKGVKNECTITDKKIVDIMTKMYKTKKNGDMMFDGITAEDINNFLRTYNDEFTSKIYRTYYANVKMIELLNKQEPSDTVEGRKKQVVDGVGCIATLLHHTKAICRKKYVDNDILEMYINDPQRYKRLFVDGSNGLNSFFKKKC